MNNIITTLDKFIVNKKTPKSEDHLLTEEFAKINNKFDPIMTPSSGFSVEVYSNDHRPPHFHFIFPDRMEFKIAIETLQVFDVVRTKLTIEEANNWLGLKKTKKWLSEWLSTVLPNQDRTNYRRIIDGWNLFHDDMLVPIDTKNPWE